MFRAILIKEMSVSPGLQKLGRFPRNSMNLFFEAILAKVRFFNGQKQKYLYTIE